MIFSISLKIESCIECVSTKLKIYPFKFHFFSILIVLFSPQLYFQFQLNYWPLEYFSLTIIYLLSAPEIVYFFALLLYDFEEKKNLKMISIFFTIMLLIRIIYLFNILNFQNFIIFNKFVNFVLINILPMVLILFFTLKLKDKIYHHFKIANIISIILDLFLGNIFFFYELESIDRPYYKTLIFLSSLSFISTVLTIYFIEDIIVKDSSILVEVEKYSYLDDRSLQYSLDILLDILNKWIYSITPDFRIDKFHQKAKSVLNKNKIIIAEKLYIGEVPLGDFADYKSLASSIIENYSDQIINDVESEYARRREKYLNKLPNNEKSKDTHLTKRASNNNKPFGFLAYKIPTTSKSSGTASLLNFLIPGAGYLYAEQMGRGFAMILFDILLIPFLLMLIFLGPIGIVFGIVLVILFAITYVYQIYDVYSFIEKINTQKSYNISSQDQSQQQFQSASTKYSNENAELGVSKVDQLRELKKLHDDGIITEEEFVKLKKEIIDE